MASRNINRDEKPTTLCKDNLSDVLSKYDLLLLDCDGVLWKTDHITPIEGISASIEKLRNMKKKLLFVTNNSIHAREAYAAKFQELPKFQADKEDVFGVAYAAAIYLKEMLKIKGKCYLIGSMGMAKELDEVGIPHVGFGPDLDEISDDPHHLIEMSHHFHQDIDAVLVGYDPHFNYTKLFKAASYLMKEECAFISTNDKEISIRLGPLCCQPITGALVPSISAATKREPFIIGKPHTHFMDCIKTKFPDIDPKTTLMIGDSIKTDIPFANKSGIDSLLVLTGVSTEQDVANATDEAFVPTYILKSLADMGHI